MADVALLTALSAGVLGAMVSGWWRTRRVPPAAAAPGQAASRDGRGPGWVKMDADRVWAKESWGFESQCLLAEVRVISVVVQPGPNGVRRTMNFRARGMGNCSFSAEAEGYHAVLSALRKWPGIDWQAYEAAVRGTEKRRWELWRRALEVNARLVSDVREAQAREEFARGLVLGRDMAGQATAVLPRETTYAELAGRADVTGTPGSTGSTDRTDYQVAGSVWVGGLEMRGVSVYGPNKPARTPRYRDDVPVESWHVDVVLTEDWDGTYAPLKAHMVKLFGPPGKWSYERADENALNWLVDGIAVRMVLWYNSEHATASGFCAVSFQNVREYPQFLTDAYVEGLRPQDVRVERLLGRAVGVGTSFRRSLRVRRTPEALRAEAEGAWLVWVDEAAGKIGFASGENAVICDRGTVARLQLQNLAPARGDGRADLTLVETDGAETPVGSGKYREFDGTLERLRRMPGVEVVVLEEWMDD